VIPVTAYVGLGSNLDDPASQLKAAITALGELDDTRLLRHSAFYRSAPWGIAEQPDFVNAVAEVSTLLPADELLEGLLGIEKRAGRIRGGSRWGPRRIDLDLLIYGDQRIDRDGLQVPHPRMAERAFVIVPLAELDPLLDVPGQGPVSQMLSGVDSQSCVRMARAG
jgi:2-amino-4-hydroxy-6-hydroxymethyldihydropteridine diphosphokinase